MGNSETLEKQYVPLWGTGGREFKSPRSDHLALLVPIRAATLAHRCITPPACFVGSGATVKFAAKN